jgi:uncharacterized membrane protein
MLNAILIGVIGIIVIRLAFKLLLKGVKLVFILTVLYIVATQVLGLQINLPSNDIMAQIIGLI